MVAVKTGRKVTKVFNHIVQRVEAEREKPAEANQQGEYQCSRECSDRELQPPMRSGVWNQIEMQSIVRSCTRKYTTKQRFTTNKRGSQQKHDGHKPRMLRMTKTALSVYENVKAIPPKVCVNEPCANADRSGAELSNTDRDSDTLKIGRDAVPK
jgi:hypothetical protein